MAGTPRRSYRVTFTPLPALFYLLQTCYFAVNIRNIGLGSNMAKNPDQIWITIGGRKIHVRPESLKGTERQEAWHRIVA